MKIILLELSKYKRLALNNIQYIKIEPENKIQLILGTNGSGKSSLMKEFNPLPGVPNQFHKDGFKRVVIHHRNSVYDLKSSFATSGNKFSFIKDDEELNPGGTVTVYKELVKKYFNITQEVIDLLNGRSNFHSMSVNERRNWFTKISDVDYSFALEYYSNLKESLRDILGGIKLNQSRLVQESEKLLSPEEESSIRDNIKTTNEFISKLLEIRKNQSSDRPTIESDIKTLDSDIASYSQKILDNYSDIYIDSQMTNLEVIDSLIEDLQINIGSISGLITTISEDIQSKQETQNLFKNSNLQSVSEINDKISSKMEEINNVKLYTELKYSNPSESLQAFIGIRSALSDIISQLEVNEDLRYSRENYNILVSDIANLKSRKDIIVNNTSVLVAAKRELEHYKNHGLTECPNCTHKWYKGYSEEKFNELTLGIEVNNTEVFRIDSELESKELYLNKIKSYFEQYRSYANITNSLPVLKSLWDYLSESKILLREPQNISNVLNKIQSDLITLVNLDNIKRELEELYKAKSLLSLTEENTLSQLEDEILDLTEQLSANQSELNLSRTRLETFKRLKVMINDVGIYNSKLTLLLEKRESKYNELIDIYRRDSINSIIMQLQLTNAKDEQLISRVDVQKALVSNIEMQLKELNDKAEVYKILIKELSPTEGLIAKSLSGFINHFLYQINSFIKKIWSYPLELVPMDNSSEEDLDLDFKFGVKVNGDIPIPDVNDCSSAMKEVIDLSFRIVSMKYLHLEEAPLYLDELGSSFDKYHRDKIKWLIDQLCLSMNFSQVFLISHYSDMYGSFVNCDITVLSDANIPKQNSDAFNKITVIE